MHRLVVDIKHDHVQGKDLLLWDVRHAQEHGPAPRVRQQVPRQAGLQEAHQDEPAHWRGRDSSLYHHPVCPHTRGTVCVFVCVYVCVNVCVCECSYWKENKIKYIHKTEFFHFSRKLPRQDSLYFLINLLQFEWHWKKISSFHPGHQCNGLIYN